RQTSLPTCGLSLMGTPGATAADYQPVARGPFFAGRCDRRLGAPWLSSVAGPAAGRLSRKEEPRRSQLAKRGRSGDGRLVTQLRHWPPKFAVMHNAAFPRTVW